jgi:hypothetical protein
MLMRKLMKVAYAIILFGASLTATPAMADAIFEYPSNWRLQNYVSNDTINIWFTSVSACPNAGLSFPASVTQEQKNRFWSMVLTAKAQNKRMGVYFTSCVIDSFYMEN